MARQKREEAKCRDASMQAAEARVAGKLPLAIKEMGEILRLQPDHARALHAMGQLQAHVKQWPQAEQAYTQAAAYERELGQKARCCYGAGKRK